VGRDELDEHVPGVGHGQGDVDVGRLSAVGPALAREVLEQEPGPDVELLHPAPHARLDVLDEVAHLKDAGQRLTEPKEGHAADATDVGSG
jgi:hypothetical protein